MYINFRMEVAETNNRGLELYEKIQCTGINMIDLGDRLYIYGKVTKEVLETIIGVCCDYGTIIYGNFYDAGLPLINKNPSELPEGFYYHCEPRPSSGCHNPCFCNYSSIVKGSDAYLGWGDGNRTHHRTLMRRL